MAPVTHMAAPAVAARAGEVVDRATDPVAGAADPPADAPGPPPGGAPAFLLGRTAYTDADWFAREQSQLFARTWALVGDASAVAHPGEYLTATVGGAPLIVTVDDDGTRRAFHNMCRHRGMVMLGGSGTCRAIRCDYHAWRYGLDGSLRVVPQRADQFPDVDPDQLGLLPAAVAEWEGLVFACPDPGVAPLDAWMAGFPDAIGSVRPGLVPQVAMADIPAACNWKLFVENHIDVYHLWYLHALSLADFEHRRFEHRAVGPHWVSYEPRRPSLSGTGSSPGLDAGNPPLAHLAERDRDGLGAHLLFPNVTMAVSAEFVITYAAVPVAPDATRIELRVRAEPGADATGLLAAARSFIDEDISACERVQAAMTSPWFEVGPLARDHEAPIAAFQRNLLAALA
jgi:phenylpropionate dioxygenase-like ring-hydroxylating dioxygenase large terminal subunit